MVISTQTPPDSSLSLCQQFLAVLFAQSFGICPLIDQRAAGGQPSVCGLASYAVIKAETKDE